MRLAIRHTTYYRFAEPVAHGLQRLRLTPKTTHGQHIREWSMSFEGAQRELEYDDHNVNRVALVSVLPGAEEVTIRCEGLVDTEDNAGLIGWHSGHLPLWAFLGRTRRTQAGAGIRALAASARGSGGDTLAMLHGLSATILGRVRYEPGVTDVGTTADEALAAGCGVCQDHAHVFIAAARSLEVPARYVSGYLMMNDRVDQDATHAWAEAHVEGLGWVGFDVANGISPDARYVRVATGRDYGEAAPITGISFGAAQEELRVALAVEQRAVDQ